MDANTVAYYVFDIRSERRLLNETVQHFTFPLSQAGIKTPPKSFVSLRVRNGLVPLQSATTQALNKQFKVYLENLPIHTANIVTANNHDARLAVAHGDYRVDQSVYAKLYGDSQPSVQLLANVDLPDVVVTLLDEDSQPFFPGADWTMTLELVASQ